MVRATALALGTAAMLFWGSGAATQARHPLPKIVEEAPPVAVAGPAVTVALFDPQKLEWALALGRNTVTGDAILRTRGGDLRTCAATQARLWPISDYTLAFLGDVFLVSGFSEPARTTRLLKSMDPGVHRYVRAVTCNGQGRFTFRDVPDGRYFLTATVTWEIPRLGRGSGAPMDLQGGDLGEMISVSGGQVLEVTLTR